MVWLHYEGKGYAPAEAAVFKCDKIDGDYEFVKGFRPLGNMSRDCGTYVDDDGTAYFFSAANDNKDLMLYRLTDDYLDIASLEAKLFPGQSREAPGDIQTPGQILPAFVGLHRLEAQPGMLCNSR